MARNKLSLPVENNSDRVHTDAVKRHPIYRSVSPRLGFSSRALTAEDKPNEFERMMLSNRGVL